MKKTLIPFLIHGHFGNRDRYITCGTKTGGRSSRKKQEKQLILLQGAGRAHTDQGRLRQMLINLLYNAIKFTDSGNVTVMAGQENDQLLLSVSDAGKGIPKASPNLIKKGPSMKLTTIRLYLVILISMTAFSCTFFSTKVHQVDKRKAGIVIRSPAKAHLYNGSLILFVDGFKISGNILQGQGIRYDLTRGRAPHKEKTDTLSAGEMARTKFLVGEYVEVTYNTQKDKKVTTKGYIKALEEEGLIVGQGLWKEKIAYQAILQIEGRQKESGFSGIRRNKNIARSKATFTTVPIDSIAFLEYYEKELQPGPLLAGMIAPVLFFAAIQNESIKKAIFGSCPTVYAFQDDTQTIQAECFSYSISPYLETDDLDRIDPGVPVDGHIVLNVKNEALETHYINQMALLAVDHPETFEAFPKNRPFLEAKDQVVLFGPESDIHTARSKSGRDVTTLVSARDEQWYQSDSTLVQQLAEEITEDWVDVKVDVPEGAKTMVVALRYKNTLFHTVQFYDMVLNEQGAQAVDWVGRTMANPIYLSKLNSWYQKYFGLRVELWNGNRLEQQVFVNDTGPIAWRQVAIELPVSDDPAAKIRFRFLPDHLMVDWVGISFDTPQAFEMRQFECKEILGFNALTSLPTALVQNDDS